jgi:hypothetical protein
VGEILFKFALDFQSIFNSDCFAAKVAGIFSNSREEKNIELMIIKK